MTHRIPGPLELMYMVGGAVAIGVGGTLAAGWVLERSGAGDELAALADGIVMVVNVVLSIVLGVCAVVFLLLTGIHAIGWLIEQTSEVSEA